MNIYTKTGDAGETSLYGGSRVSKDNFRVWCYGTVDEACSVLGVIHAAIAVPRLKEIVRAIQIKMFTLAAELASGEGVVLKERITEADTAFLEGLIDSYTRDLGKFKGFTVPGETVCSSLFHVARTVVRRCERHVISLAAAEAVPPDVLKYINRLSDALYALAKIEVFEMFVKEVASRVACEVGEAPSGDWSEGLCTALFRAAAEESAKIGIAISFALADEAGNQTYFHRQPGAILASVAISQNKAYTAAALGMTTAELGRAAAPGGSLFGINASDQRLVIFGGGFPLFKGGVLKGALGISGGSVEEDERIGKAVLAAFEKANF